MVISLGTSGTAFLISKSGSADPSGEVAGFADATGNFLPLACTLNAAKIFASTAQSLGVTFTQFSELALSAQPGAGGLTFLPHFDGERTPNRPEAKGQLLNMTHTNFTPENICRAAIEGVVASMAYATQALLNLGHSYERIFLIGGAARNKAVQKIAADFFGGQILIPAEGEYVADGAAKQAAWALSGKEDLPHWGGGRFESVESAVSSNEIRERYLAAIRSI